VRLKKIAFVAACFVALFCAAESVRGAHAQGQQEQAQGQQGQATTGAAPASAEEAARGTRVPLAQPATAFDATGREALSATLLTRALAGTPEAPVRNTRVVLRNAGASFYNYVAGYVTFYDEGGVRCGAGLFTFGAAAPGESVEADTPGLRLTCTPVTWRVITTTLLTATGDAAQPRTVATAQPAPDTTQNPVAPAQPVVPPLEINVNGRTIPIQLGNPLEVVVGNERLRIVVQPAP
jgi:hypothetical protein